MTVLERSRHLGDDDLIRYMDHQLDREGQRVMGAHLRTCASCNARLDAFHQKSALAREWLGLLPAEMPDPGKRAVALAAVDRARFRRRGTGVMATAWVKAAAAVVLLVSVGLATEPMRGFVARGVVQVGGNEPGSAAARIAEWLGHTQPRQPQPRLASAEAPTPPPAVVYAPETEAPAVAPARAVQRTAPAVKRGMSPPMQFTPDGPDVSLAFSSVQAAGTATIWIREVPRASVQAVRGYRGEELAPADTGLVVRNRPGSRAEYVITVPSRYRYIRVRVADGPVVQIATTKSKQEWIWTINLQSSALDDQMPED